MGEIMTTDPMADSPLLCPVCGEELILQRRTDGRPGGLGCTSGHRFDAARQGHVNLLTGRPSPHVEDTRQMVASRESWLGAGHYAPLAHALANAAVAHAPHPQHGLRLVDTGAGTGYYTSAVLDALAERPCTGPASGITMDLSRAAAQRAARDPRVLSLVWDTWSPWPLAADSTDVLLDVFAPRNLTEFARVLRPGGLALVAVPLPGHLEQIRSAGLLGMDQDKERRLAEGFSADFEEVDTADVAAEIPLTPDSGADLVHMGPAGHHSDRDEILRRLQEHPVPTVSLEVRVHAYRRLRN